jgi:GNAT superfamily N-acetyltransferase
MLPSIRIEVCDLDDPVARALERRHSAEMSARYGGDGCGPSIAADFFRPPAGCFLVAWADDRALGCAGLRPLVVDGQPRAAKGELKRLFVDPDARRLGVGRSLLRAIERVASDIGYRALWLETGTAQPEALRLYETEGYERIQPYGEYRDEPGSRCFARSLSPRN